MARLPPRGTYYWTPRLGWLAGVGTPNLEWHWIPDLSPLAGYSELIPFSEGFVLLSQKLTILSWGLQCGGRVHRPQRFSVPLYAGPYVRRKPTLCLDQMPHLSDVMRLLDLNWCVRCTGFGFDLRAESFK
jgi:hypothetical protein